MPGTLKNYYEILGIPRSATTDQIRTAYRKLLLKFHPDKNIGDSYFEEWSKKINEAFEVLMNTGLRAEYDQVYDETRLASRQPVPQHKDAPDDNSQMERMRPVSVNDTIQKLAPVYISAKQAYIKAERNVAAIEAGVKAKAMNARAHFLLGGILLGAILVWMGITNKELLQISSTSASPIIDRAAIIPLPSSKKKDQKTVAEPPFFEEVPVDLWLKVVASKTYFWKRPGGAVLDEKFLSGGNKVHATKKAGNYYYGVFRSAVNSSYKIEGWIKMEDVEILAQ